MMLFTATLLPPSWLAMLPQKFSAATTCNFPDDEPAAEPALPPPQAAQHNGAAHKQRHNTQRHSNHDAPSWDI